MSSASLEQDHQERAPTPAPTGRKTLTAPTAPTVDWVIALSHRPATVPGFSPVWGTTQSTPGRAPADPRGTDPDAPVLVGSASSPLKTVGPAVARRSTAAPGKTLVQARFHPGPRWERTVEAERR